MIRGLGNKKMNSDSYLRVGHRCIREIIKDANINYIF